MALPILSVVVPTHQRDILVEGLLRALERQTLPAPDFEVIVIIDGSTDATAERLARLAPPYALTWRWQPQAGRATACNRGLALARGSVVVLLDDDMEPTPRLLAAHLAAHPPGTRLAVVGAAPIVTVPGSPPLAEYVARKFNRHLASLAAPGRHVGLRDFYSGNLSMRRDILAELGGFDEEFIEYGNEDLELSCRLRNAGVEIVFDAHAMAHQRYTKDVAALARDKLAQGRTAVQLAAKHPATIEDLKLAAQQRGSLRRRLSLDVLVALSRVCPAMPARAVGWMGGIGTWKQPYRDRAFAFAADYFFMIGATGAQRRAAARGTRR